jgi:adenylate cyclase
MKLGARALVLFAVVGVVPVTLVVSQLISINRRAVITTEQQLHSATIDELKNITLRHIEGVRADTNAVAITLDAAARGPAPEAGRDGLEGVRAMLASREEIDAVRFEVPASNVSTILRRQDEARNVTEVPSSTPELQRIADERGVAVASLGGGRGIVVVPIRPMRAAANAANTNSERKGYVTTALYLDKFNDELMDIAQRRFSGAVGLAVVDANRVPIATYNMSDLEKMANPGSHPLWSGYSEQNTTVVGVSRVAPFTSVSGEKMIGVLELLPGYGWGVIAVRREEDAYEVLAAMQRRGIYVTIFAILLALGVGAWAARSVSKPIVQLAKQARRLGERKWRDVALETERSDEIGDLNREFSSMAKDLEESEALIVRQAKQRADLGRFLSKELVDAIVSGEHELSLGGRRATVSVLFADVVAFTPLAENKPAEEVVAILNELFSILTEVVFRHGGTVDKFVGDCIMAVWGAPVAQEDHASRALAAAEDMMRFLETANESFRERYGITLELGIGINSGEVLVGNIGSDKRMEYTVIGDVVNVAARLEAIARPNQVLLADATRESVGDAFEIEFLGEKAVTGRKAMTKVFELVVN